MKIMLPFIQPHTTSTDVTPSWHGTWSLENIWSPSWSACIWNLRLFWWKINISHSPIRRWYWSIIIRHPKFTITYSEFVHFTTRKIIFSFFPPWDYVSFLHKSLLFSLFFFFWIKLLYKKIIKWNKIKPFLLKRMH